MKLHPLVIEKKHKGKCFKTTKDHIVYKHVFGTPYNGIAILVIPKGSRIVCVDNYNQYRQVKNRKLRTERAYCIGIIPYCGYTGNYESFSKNERFYSMKHPDFKYKIGDELKPTMDFCDRVYDACRPGIHFFASLKDAQQYTNL